MAWKNFQNGYPLYASELNNYLMNQSVVVFASAAERDSVLTAPTEGQVVWLQDTNAFKIYNGTVWTDINDNTDAIQKSLLTTAGDTIYATGSATPARLALGSTGSLLKSNGSAPAWLGVGTSGQVLSSTGSDLAWTTIAAGGGMTLLSTTTLSGTTTSITGISQSYKNLFIRIQNITAAANSQVVINAYSGSTAIGTSDLIGVDTNGSTPNPVKRVSRFPTPTLMKATGGANIGIYEIINYTATSNLAKATRLYGLAESDTGTALLFNYAGSFWSATSGAINRIDIDNDRSTFNGGTVYIYGVN